MLLAKLVDWFNPTARYRNASEPCEAQVCLGLFCMCPVLSFRSHEYCRRASKPSLHFSLSNQQRGRIMRAALIPSSIKSLGTMVKYKPKLLAISTRLCPDPNSLTFKSWGPKWFSYFTVVWSGIVWAKNEFNWVHLFNEHWGI